MREKKLRLVVTFHTTAAAMATEKICMEQKIAGRLAPVPRSLSSDCGIAWIGQTEDREKLETLTARLEVDKMTELLL